METVNAPEVLDRLKTFALTQSRPFCYPCYQPAPLGRCEFCHSDDLARELPNHGIDYGWDWILPILLREHLAPVRTEELFEESVRECYSETTRIGWIEIDTTTAIRELDPTSWRIALAEWEEHEASEGRLISLDHGARFYDVSELESFLDRALASDLTE